MLFISIRLSIYILICLHIFLSKYNNIIFTTNVKVLSMVLFLSVYTYIYQSIKIIIIDIIHYYVCIFMLLTINHREKKYRFETLAKHSLSDCLKTFFSNFWKQIFFQSYCPFPIFLLDFSVNLKTNYAKTRGGRIELFLYINQQVQDKNSNDFFFFCPKVARFLVMPVGLSDCLPG